MDWWFLPWVGIAGQVGHLMSAGYREKGSGEIFGCHKDSPSPPNPHSGIQVGPGMGNDKCAVMKDLFMHGDDMPFSRCWKHPGWKHIMEKKTLR